MPGFNGLGCFARLPRHIRVLAHGGTHFAVCIKSKQQNAFFDGDVLGGDLVGGAEHAHPQPSQPAVGTGRVENLVAEFFQNQLDDIVRQLIRGQVHLPCLTAVSASQCS